MRKTQNGLFSGEFDHQPTDFGVPYSHTDPYGPELSLLASSGDSNCTQQTPLGVFAAVSGAQSVPSLCALEGEHDLFEQRCTNVYQCLSNKFRLRMLNNE